MEPQATSYAIFAEFARESNIKMKNGLNRRRFNTVETKYGHGIQLETDGSIKLHPGTYRLTGFSLVTMQATFAPPVMQHNLNYPGYCLLYDREFEDDNPLAHQIGIGSPGTAYDGSPSHFDIVITCEKDRHICVGHQSGDQLNDEVYLSVYEVDGIPSEYHLFARIAVYKL